MTFQYPANFLYFLQSENIGSPDGDAHKFFVTGVKDLSTGVKYMDSKVDFWFYSYRCQVSEYRCQVYGFQSGVLVLFVPGGQGGQNV